MEPAPTADELVRLVEPRARCIPPGTHHSVFEPSGRRIGAGPNDRHNVFVQVDDVMRDALCYVLNGPRTSYVIPPDELPLVPR
ncbi:hypothetical protein ACFWWT_24260 [Streptomyces sp. NPDC058676]|uniref:hypothetical protein n=1 Tax=unclassified Streptomyces TaxID=2593676 RepID=UPI0036522314